MCLFVYYLKIVTERRDLRLSFVQKVFESWKNLNAWEVPGTNNCNFLKITYTTYKPENLDPQTSRKLLISKLENLLKLINSYKWEVDAEGFFTISRGSLTQVRTGTHNLAKLHHSL